MAFLAPARDIFEPQPLYNPPVPLTIPVQGGMFPGKMIFLAGTISPVAKRYTINIQDGMHPGSNIGLHFDVRINYDGYVKMILRNASKGGQWGDEETHRPYFPFKKGETFELIFLADVNCYKVAVNNQHFVEFKHRYGPLSRFNVLSVKGDITLQQVRFQ